MMQRIQMSPWLALHSLHILLLCGSSEALVPISGQRPISHKPVTRRPPSCLLRSHAASTVSSTSAQFTSEQLIQMGKDYFAASWNGKGLGPVDPAPYLSDDFQFVAPLVGPLGKEELTQAAKAFLLEEGLPDLDARYHHFRVDPWEPNRVWCTSRTTGTHTGVINFGGLKAKPKVPARSIESPPEAVSLTFDSDGKVSKITTGYALDRLVGNTGGLGGLFGVLQAIGYPLPPILTRTVAQIISGMWKWVQTKILRRPAAEAPVPVVVESTDQLDDHQLLQLAQDLIESNFGSRNQDLLAPSFIFSGPIVGPLERGAFLSVFSSFNIADAFPDLQLNLHDLRLDPYEVNRVWWTTRPEGTHKATLVLGKEEFPATGRPWKSPPEAGSAVFDAKGRCLQLTGGYIMDRQIGNTGGLGGVFGIRHAIGKPLPLVLSATPAQLGARAKRRLTFWK